MVAKTMETLVDSVQKGRADVIQGMVSRMHTIIGVVRTHARRSPRLVSRKK